MKRWVVGLVLAAFLASILFLPYKAFDHFDGATVAYGTFLKKPRPGTSLGTKDEIDFVRLGLEWLAIAGLGVGLHLLTRETKHGRTDGHDDGPTGRPARDG